MFNKARIKVYSFNKLNNKRKIVKLIIIKWNIKLNKFIKSRINIE